MSTYRGVQGGTPIGDPLCRTCRFCQRMKGQSEGQEIVYCQYLGKPMPFEAMECGMYEDKRQPSLNEMKRVAWVLRTEKFGRAIGFVSAEEWRKTYRKDDYNDVPG